MGLAKGTASAPNRERHSIWPILFLHSSPTQPLPREDLDHVQEP